MSSTPNNASEAYLKDNAEGLRDLLDAPVSASDDPSPDLSRLKGWDYIPSVWPHCNMCNK